MLAGSTLAIGDTSCSIIDGGDARVPLSVNNGILCFKLQPVLDKQGNPLLSEESQIYIYFVGKGRAIVKIRELPYLATTGIIEDAFLLDVNRDKKKDVVIIHSAEITTYTGTCKASPWYTVIILKQIGSYFEYDERASNWFGYGGDLCKDDIDTIIYVYPFKTKNSIKKAITVSPVASFIVEDTPKVATVKRKSWLYDDGARGLKTKKYLIDRDKVTINKVQANMCQVSYSGEEKSLRMWLKCSDLNVVESVGTIKGENALLG
jgi:hypothetical protein